MPCCRARRPRSSRADRFVCVAAWPGDLLHRSRCAPRGASGEREHARWRRGSGLSLRVLTTVSRPRSVPSPPRPTHDHPAVELNSARTQPACCASRWRLDSMSAAGRISRSRSCTGRWRTASRTVRPEARAMRGSSQPTTRAGCLRAVSRRIQPIALRMKMRRVDVVGGCQGSAPVTCGGSRPACRNSCRNFA